MNTPLSRLQHDISLAPGIPDSFPLFGEGPTVSTYGDLREVVGKADAPIKMLLFCPKCGMQHVDQPEDGDPSTNWTNPPHRSHLCHACGCIWRPADVPTEGVKAIETKGGADTWSALSAVPPSQADHIPDAGKMVPPSQGMETDDSGLAAADNNHKALVEAVTAALAKYGAHELECEIVEDGPACSCGFHDALTAFQSRQDDKTICASDDPEERCLRCDCWKFTRETCS